MALLICLLFALSVTRTPTARVQIKELKSMETNPNARHIAPPPQGNSARDPLTASLFPLLQLGDPPPS